MYIYSPRQGYIYLPRRNNICLQKLLILKLDRFKEGERLGGGVQEKKTVTAIETKRK